MNAKFAIGEIVYHALFNYRGVVIDIDPVFSGEEAWYQNVALTRPPKDRPWYHVLVDEASHQTYVAERNLKHCEDLTPIDHPWLEYFFSEIINGKYALPKSKTN